MRTLLLSALGLSMSLTAMANGEMKDGWLIVEDFETQPTVVTYNFNNNPKKATITYIDDPASLTGKVLSTEDTEWQEIVELDVTLPTGKTIADYAQIAFDYYSLKTSYKKIKIMVDNSEVFYSEGYNEVTSTKKWIQFSKAIPEGLTSGNKIKLRFGVDNGEGGQILYDNVRLLPKADKVGETMNGQMIGNDFMIEDFEALIMGSTYDAMGNTTVSVAENPDGTGLVGKVANSNYSAFPQFAVKLPEGKTIANVKAVKFDIYINTKLDGQPSDPTYKQRRIAINGTEVYYDIDENGDQDYPGSGAGDQWATVTLDINKLGKVTDAMKELNEFKLAVGIHDNKLQYFIDNVKLTLGEAEVKPVEPEKVYTADELSYIKKINPVGYTNAISAELKIEFESSSSLKPSKVEVNGKPEAIFRKDGVDIMTQKITDDRNSLIDKIVQIPSDLLDKTSNYYYGEGAGEYELYIPAEAFTVTLKDGSNIKTPAMKTTWHMIDLPQTGTETDPITDFKFMTDLVKDGADPASIAIRQTKGNSKLFYRCYVVGWIEKDGTEHFENFKIGTDNATNYFATLIADKIDETDIDRCLTCGKTGSNLSIDDSATETKNGNSTYHKYYQASTSSFMGAKVSNSTKYMLKTLSALPSSKVEVADPAGVDDVVADAESNIVTVYNLQGIQILKDADRSELNNLPAGLYIVNGKKTLVK